MEKKFLQTVNTVFVIFFLILIIIFGSISYIFRRFGGDPLKLKSPPVWKLNEQKNHNIDTARSMYL